MGRGGTELEQIVHFTMTMGMLLFMYTRESY